MVRRSNRGIAVERIIRSLVLGRNRPAVRAGELEHIATGRDIKKAVAAVAANIDRRRWVEHPTAWFWTERDSQWGIAGITHSRAIEPQLPRVLQTVAVRILPDPVADVPEWGLLAQADVEGAEVGAIPGQRLGHAGHAARRTCAATGKLQQATGLVYITVAIVTRGRAPVAIRRGVLPVASSAQATQAHLAQAHGEGAVGRHSKEVAPLAISHCGSEHSGSRIGTADRCNGLERHIGNPTIIGRGGSSRIAVLNPIIVLIVPHPSTDEGIVTEQLKITQVGRFTRRVAGGRHKRAALRDTSACPWPGGIGVETSLVVATGR